MTQGLQQQGPAVNFSIPKSQPQHGQRADMKRLGPAKPPRSFEPRPGH